MSEPLTDAPLHCWEVPDWPSEQNATCMLLDGHDGPHQFTPDAEITVRFR